MHIAYVFIVYVTECKVYNIFCNNIFNIYKTVSLNNCLYIILHVQLIMSVGIISCK